MSTETRRFQCRHIFAEGRRCGSPCLRHEEFCYHHHTTRTPIANPRERQSRRSAFTLPPLEDRTAIQLAITEIVRRIAANALDPRRAGLLLYGLQIASSNLPRTPAGTAPSPMVEDIVEHPAHGPLAPVAEVEPEAAQPTLEQVLVQQWQQDRTQQDATRQDGLLPSLQARAALTPPRRQHRCRRPAIISLMASSAPNARRPASHPEQLGQLPTEQRNPASEHLDELSTLDMLGIINDQDALAARAVRAALPHIAAVVDAIAARFAQGGRVFYLGAGTSGRLGVLDASECPPTFSVEPGRFVGLIAGGDSALRKSSEGSEDSAQEGADALAAYDPSALDTVVGIAASGRTPWVLGALAGAKERGALTVALTCAGGSAQPSRMAAAAELAIELATGPEVLTGSTRMKAGTATKLVLNSLSTGVMVRMGAVFGNLMVDVQPTNAKLIDRAQRIVAAATGCDPATAERLLREAGSVKVAIVMQTLGLPYAAAASRLKRLGGNLRHALDRL